VFQAFAGGLQPDAGEQRPCRVRAPSGRRRTGAGTGGRGRVRGGTVDMVRMG
jgi:hypothetical protein